MSYHLFLDDMRNPKQVHWAKLPECSYWVIAKNFSEFRELILNKGVPLFIAFDCDLAEEHYQYANRIEFLIKQYAGQFEHKTGIDCALFLSKHCEVHKRPLPDFVVHSMNKIGGAEIEKIMLDSKKKLAKENLS